MILDLEYLATGKKMGKVQRNERNKLTATFLNSIAIAIFTTGGVVPYFHFYETLSSGSLGEFWSFKGYVFVASIVAAMIISLFTHWLAQNFLEKIED